MRRPIRIVLLALVLVLGATFSPARAAGEGGEPRFRPGDESPSGAAEVLIGHLVVVRLRAPAGGFTADERAQMVVIRLTSLLFHGLKPAEIMPAVLGGEVVVGARGLPIVNVDEETARQQGTSRLALALAWSNNLRRSLGAPPCELFAESGLASWYGPGFHGRRTASGELFDQHALTAAHRTLPFGTVAVVTRVDTGESVTVRINDRGPWLPGRIIDLSLAAARQIGLVTSGLLEVQVRAWMAVDDGSR